MATDIPPTRVSTYLQYLPAIFQQDADQQGVTFIGRFLLAFEKILSGLDDPDQPGLEEKIARIHTYFDPGPGQLDATRTPRDFLPWLASWVALTLRADWEPEEQRRFISRIVPLYQLRGTKAGLMEMLRTYTGMGVEILEYHRSFTVGDPTAMDKTPATVGVDTYIGGAPPHFFRVRMVFTTLDPNFDLRRRIARAIIDQEKPAHTYYDLEVITPTMQIGVNSTVGVDTLLGTP